MVMDTALPQAVGREFVRQYYTLLNKAPEYLHLFYNFSSIFDHDKTPLVVGQKNIHKKIQQLNYHNCHAKVSQIDSQSTLDNGVVVQVTGELSNDGQPMRRFTQTFILALQAPQKYCVHNDIFRYQVFYTDEENDGESHSENDENQGNVVKNIQQPGQSIKGYAQQQPQQQQMNGAVHDDLQSGLINQAIQTPTIPQQLTLPTDPSNILTMPLQSKIDEAVDVTPTATLTTAMDTETSCNEQTMPSETETSCNEQTMPSETEPTKEGNEPEKITRDDTETSSEMVIGEQYNRNMELKTKPSYADLLNSGSDVRFASVASTALNSGNLRSVNTSTYSSRTQPDARSNQSQTAPQRHISSRQPPREEKSSNVNEYPDNYKLFVGNIPHQATEEALKVIFSKYGNVVNLRILSNSSVSDGPSRPNFGFLIYNDSESVEDCLKHLPLFFQGRKLNIERKKRRTLSDSSSIGGNGGMNRNIPEWKFNGRRMDRGGNDRNDRINDRNSGDRGNGRGSNRGPSAGNMLRETRGIGSISNNSGVRGSCFNGNANNRSVGRR